jgi:hypothetical protein
MGVETMSDWISVKDRLPDDGVMVLVNVDRYRPPVSVGECRGGHWALVCNIGTVSAIDYDSRPSHWMPFPPPHVPNLTVKEALREAVAQLGILEQQGFSAFEKLLPRLRAALESEE